MNNDTHGNVGMLFGNHRVRAHHRHRTPHAGIHKTRDHHRVRKGTGAQALLPNDGTTASPQQNAVSVAVAEEYATRLDREIEKVSQDIRKMTTLQSGDSAPVAKAAGSSETHTSTLPALDVSDVVMVNGIGGMFGCPPPAVLDIVQHTHPCGDTVAPSYIALSRPMSELVGESTRRALHDPVTIHDLIQAGAGDRNPMNIVKQLDATGNHVKKNPRNLDPREYADPDGDWFQETGVYMDGIFDDIARHEVLASRANEATAAGRRDVIRPHVSTMEQMYRACADFPTTTLTPADMVAMLFEPSVDVMVSVVGQKGTTVVHIKERYCMNGSDCKARQLLYHEHGDVDESAKQNPSYGYHGVILKEYLTQKQRAIMYSTGQYPENRQPCIICLLHYGTVASIRHTITGAAYNPIFTCPVDTRGGYEGDICSPAPVSGHLRQRVEAGHTPNFDIGYYIPTTLKDIVDNKKKILKACPRELALLIDSVSRHGKPIRGFVEDSRIMHYFPQTRWLPSLIRSDGSEPNMSYVRGNHSMTIPPGVSPMAPHLIDIGECETIHTCTPDQVYTWIDTTAARLTGYELTALHLLLGPFAVACIAVKFALRWWATGDTTLDVIPRFLVFSHEPIQTLTALVDIIRSSDWWDRFALPVVLHKWSVYVTTVARMSVHMDVHRTLERSLTSIAKFESQEQSACDRVTKAAAKTQSPDTPPPPPTAAQDATSIMHDSDAFAEPTQRQLEQKTRVTIANTKRHEMGHTKIDTEMRMSIPYEYADILTATEINNANLVFSREHQSHTGALRWLLSTYGSACQDDVVIGCTYAMEMDNINDEAHETEAMKLVYTALDVLSPDVLCPPIQRIYVDATAPLVSADDTRVAVPGAGDKSAASATSEPATNTWKDDAQVVIPYMARITSRNMLVYGLDDPPMHKIQYAPHRENILRWLATPELGKTHFGVPVFATQDLLEAMEMIGATASVSTASREKWIKLQKLHATHRLVLGDLFRPFNACVQAFRMHTGADAHMITALWGVVNMSVPAKLMESRPPIVADDAEHTQRDGKCSIAAAALCRTIVADLLTRHTHSTRVASGLHLFASTHTDMICGIKWGSNMTTTLDAELLEQRQMPGPLDKHTISLYRLNYPRDARYHSDAASPPMITVLKHSGILEPPAASSTQSSTLISKEIAPRACISRELFRVIVGLCNSDYATSLRILRCVRDMLVGNIAHTEIYPTTATCIEINRMCDTIEHEMLLRVDQNTIAAAKARLRLNLASIAKIAHSMDESPQDAAPEIVHTLLMFRDAHARTKQVFASMAGTAFDAPYRVVADIITSEVASAISIEMYRQLVSKTASTETKGVFLTDHGVDALNSVMSVDGVRTPPRHTSVLNVIATVISTHLVATRDMYHSVVTTAPGHAHECPFAKEMVTALEGALEPVYSQDDAEGVRNVDYPSDEVAMQVKCDTVLQALTFARQVVNCDGLCGPTGTNREPAVQICAKELRVACCCALMLASKKRLSRDESAAIIDTIVDESILKAIETVITTTPLLGDCDARVEIKSRFVTLLRTHVKWPSDVKSIEMTCERAAEDIVTAIGRFLAHGMLHEVMMKTGNDAALIVQHAPGIIDTISRTDAKSAHAVCKLAHGASRVGELMLADFIRRGKVCAGPEYAVFGAELHAIIAEADARNSTKLLSVMKARPTNRPVTCAAPSTVFDADHILDNDPILSDYRQQRIACNTEASALEYVETLRARIAASLASTKVDTMTIDPSDLSKLLKLEVVDATEFSGIIVTYINTIAEYVHNTKLSATAHLTIEHSPSGITMDMTGDQLEETPSFIEDNYTLIDVAQRNLFVSAMSRATPLCSTFTANDKWFPAYMRFISLAAGYFQSFFVRNSRLPTTEEATTALQSIRKTTGKKEVFRIFRRKCIATLEKTFFDLETLLRSEGFFAVYNSKRAQKNDSINRQFMWKVISTECTAHRLDQNPITSAHIITMLKTFGLSKRARILTIKLISTYELHGGCHKLNRIAARLKTTEVHLLLAFFSLLKTATNVEYTPLCNRRDIEAGLCAIATRRGKTPGQPIPMHMVELCACPRCSTLTSQIMAPGITPIDTSNHHGSAVNERGNIVCAEHKSVSERHIKAIINSGITADIGTGAAVPRGISSEAKDGDADDLEGMTLDNLDGLAGPKQKRRKKHTSKKGTAQAMTIDGKPPPPSMTSWPTPCTATIVQKHYMVGAMVRFFPQKASGLSEKQFNAKEPCCICPCCGLIGRYISDHTDRYGSITCPACVIGIGDTRYDAQSCAVCGVGLVAASARALLEVTTATTNHIDPTVCIDLPGLACPVKSPSNQDRFQTGLARIGVAVDNRTLALSNHAAIRCAADIPMASVDVNNAMVFDDLVLHQVHPDVFCEVCANLPSVRTSKWPIRLSVMRQEAKEQRIDMGIVKLAKSVSAFGPGIRKLLQTLFRNMTHTMHTNPHTPKSK